MFLKKGEFKYCFKDGTTKLPYKRNSFGGSLKETTENINEIAEGMYSELFRFPNPKNKIHPTQKPKEFSGVFKRITKSNIVLDPFCGSGTLLSAFPNGTGIDVKKYI